MNKNISDYKWVMLWAADVCSSLSWAAPEGWQEVVLATIIDPERCK